MESPPFIGTQIGEANTSNAERLNIMANRNELLNNLKKKAKLGGLSPLMDGRKKMSMDDFNGSSVTIAGVDIVEYDEDDKKVRYGVIVTEEYPEYYINGGKATTDLVDGIIFLCNETKGKNDFDTVNDFVKELKLKLKAEKVTTKGKRPFTRIEIE